MTLLKITEISLLLEVFREGLVLGIITKDEVVDWSDSIITEKDDVDYLFIELSLSKDKNALITVINEYVKETYSPVCTRVLFGCIYKEMLKDDHIEKVGKILSLLSKLSNEALTEFECGKLYEFDDYDIYYDADSAQLRLELVNFLETYEPFTIQNYQRWEEINEQVLGIVKVKQAEAIEVNRLNREFLGIEGKRVNKKGLLLTSLLSILIIFTSGLIYYYLRSPSHNREDNICLGVFLALCTFSFVIRLADQYFKKG